MWCYVTPPGHPEVMEALREAAREAGSTSAQDFTIQFNVDILAPGVRHADPEVWLHAQ